LDSPIIDKDGEYYLSSSGIEVGSSGMQGWRLEMEDAHIVCDIPSRNDHLFLAVFDGHAGGGAAKFAAENMIGFLEKTIEWKNYLECDCERIDLLGESLIRAFVDLDERMKMHQESTYGKDSSGCTGVTCVVTPKFIICANAGDSRCVMGIGNTAKALSDDHKPYNETERKRIESAGGFVQWNRVDGDLAVSRALGDFSYKNRPDLSPRDQKVSVLMYF
jgi:serine/threonine protein phosphatase PrpC